MDRWYIARGKAKKGPFSLAQLQMLAEKGRIRPTDLLRQSGTKKWIPAQSLSGPIPARSAMPDQASSTESIPPSLCRSGPASQLLIPAGTTTTVPGLLSRKWLWIGTGGIGCFALASVFSLVLILVAGINWNRSHPKPTTESVSAIQQTVPEANTGETKGISGDKEQAPEKDSAKPVRPGNDLPPVGMNRPPEKDSPKPATPEENLPPFEMNRRAADPVNIKLQANRTAYRAALKKAGGEIAIRKEAVAAYADAIDKAIASYEQAGEMDRKKLGPLLAEQKTLRHSDFFGIWENSLNLREIWIISVDQKTGDWQVKGAIKNGPDFAPAPIYHGEGISFKEGTLSFVLVLHSQHPAPWRTGTQFAGDNGQTRSAHLHNIRRRDAGRHSFATLNRSPYCRKHRIPRGQGRFSRIGGIHWPSRCRERRRGMVGTGTPDVLRALPGGGEKAIASLPETVPAISREHVYACPVWISASDGRNT